MHVVFTFGSTQCADGLRSAKTWTNGKLDHCKNAKWKIYSKLQDLMRCQFCRKSEVIALICASLLGMPGGCLLFVLFYHPLHDFCELSSEVTFICIASVFIVILWRFDRKSNRYQKPSKINLISKILLGHLVVHYLINLGSAIFFNPEDVVSVGLHQTIGNCNETEPVETLLKVLYFLYLFFSWILFFFYI